MKSIFKFPSSILILPQIDFDDEGNIISISTVSLNLQYNIIAEAEKSNDIYINDFNYCKEFLNKIKEELKIGGAKIMIKIDQEFKSLNQELSILLSSFASFLELYGIDFKLYLKQIDEYVLKNRLSFISPSTLLHRNLVLKRKLPFLEITYELPIELIDYYLVIVELGDFDINYFLKDKWYRKVISHHSNSSFDFFLSNQDLQSLYEANNKFAFQAGLLEPELEELMKIAKELGSDYVGYNFFSKAFHCLVNYESFEKFYSNLLGILSKNIKISYISFMEN